MRRALLTCLAVVPVALGISAVTPTAAMASTACSTGTHFYVKNFVHQTYVTAEDGFGQYAQGVSPPSMYFCTISVGNGEYQYKDSHGYCATANASNHELYEASSGWYPASQEWHLYAVSGHPYNTLKNAYTGLCVWFLSPFNGGDLINVGGCTPNQNNEIVETHS